MSACFLYISQYTIFPGSVTFPFSLEIPGDPHWPAPFKSVFGSLVYRVVVYMKSPTAFVEVGEKVMRFNGHHNLNNNIDALKPISVEQFYKKSVFSRKKLVEVIFSVETSGYLPEERIPFVLSIRNPKCIPLQMSVQLVQELKYDASNRRDSAKRKIMLVASSERDEFEPEPELTWIDNLRIPEELGPSYKLHYTYNVTYSIQFKVKVLDQGTVKGGAPIYIGTTREPEQLLMLLANNLDVPYQGLRRRGSTSSTHSNRSHSSTTTTYSLPPAYSQLSSRILSMETLPPSYDEVESDYENTQILALEVPTNRLLATTPELPEEGAESDEPD
ncbi:Arrestin domain-containing protein 2 [Orchesella cincta]|uniref:Arrestin domain-containing protein 2 n=1 Tax=Orchesella cincta TaxID=48709 RepID=A0A1D2NI61_ORCCI|nr:Arrestin domain-containing protein 2 [Orchesella cincta]